ncbi:UNVERIFIED_CONTAM: protein disulfide-isomerase precursor [Siphonaria sp. JEL0065]|nr:protein disulfide-isomerase precursor [Siphonaria sp. JEL0065]
MANTTLVSLLSLLAIVSSVFATGKCASKEIVEEVQILRDPKIFRSWAKRKGSEEDPIVSLVLFCDHNILSNVFTAIRKECSKATEEFEKVAVKLAVKGIEFGSVDCSKQKEICIAAKAFTTRLPLFKSYRNGQVNKYTNEVSAEHLSKYILRQIKGTIRAVKNTQKSIDDFKASEDFTVLGIFADEFSPNYRQYIMAAKALQGNYTFGYSFGADEEHIVAHSISNEFETLFDSSSVKKESPDDADEFTKVDIVNFVKTANLPLVADLDADNFGVYTAMKLPIAFTLLHDLAAREHMLEILTPLAKLYRGYLNFLLIDGAKFNGLADSLGGNDGKKKAGPQFVINEFDPEYFNYPLKDVDLLSEDGEVALAGFIESFILGEAKPMISSEEIPEPNDQDIKVIVGETFQELVLDSKKDVLLMFMKSETDYKERFERIYKKIARVVASQTSNIVVAKLNMKYNSLPKGMNFKVNVVPKLLLVKSVKGKSGKSAVDYALDKNALLLSKSLEFLENNSNYAADLKELNHDEL